MIKEDTFESDEADEFIFSNSVESDDVQVNPANTVHIDDIVEEC